MPRGTCRETGKLRFPVAALRMARQRQLRCAPPSPAPPQRAGWLQHTHSTAEAHVRVRVRPCGDGGRWGGAGMGPGKHAMPPAAWSTPCIYPFMVIARKQRRVSSPHVPCVCVRGCVRACSRGYVGACEVRHTAALPLPSSVVLVSHMLHASASRRACHAFRAAMGTPMHEGCHDIATCISVQLQLQWSQSPLRRGRQGNGNH